MSNFFTLLADKRWELLDLFVEHMNMTTIAVLISLAIGVPLGILICRNKKVSSIVIGIANVFQSIPSLALLAFAVPFVGIGTKPAIIMVIVYALLPIIKNTYTGISGIDPKMIEAARGTGLNRTQRLFKVQLPIAAPFIMAGVRISAVTAVGTMTIASFVGAGGLGWFINLGLNSGDPAMVLLGAIPASLLALLLDFILSKLEKVITPEGLKPADQIQHVSRKKRRRQKAVVFALCGILVALPIGTNIAESMGGQDRTVVIGTSNFTEAIILGYVYSELIEANTDLTVEQKFNLNGTTICFNALKGGSIDMVTSYTGTALTGMLQQPISSDVDEVYDTVKTMMQEQFDIRVSKPLGFNNNYVLSVRPETAQQYNLEKLSDLAAVSSELRLGATVDFIQREDNLPSLKEEYGISFKEENGLAANIRYQAITSGQVDIIDAFSTDAMLEKTQLTTLEDDRNFFPPYYAINLVRGDTLEQHPELEAVLAKLDGVLDEPTMRNMNYQVDVEGKDAQQVAHDFLAEKGLI